MPFDSNQYFQILYKEIKKLVIEEMNRQKTGTVTFLIKNSPKYISSEWLAAITARLDKELKEEFGVSRVCFQDANSNKQKEAAIIVEG